MIEAIAITAFLSFVIGLFTGTALWSREIEKIKESRWEKAAKEYQKRVDVAKAFEDPPRSRWKKGYK